MKTLTLRISNSGAHFSDTGFIPWSATNLPSGDFRFSERTDIYWQVIMLAYDKNTARLRVQVLDFEAKPESFVPGREMKSPVRMLEFMPLAEAPFKAQLSYYKAGALKDILLPKTSVDEPALHPASAPGEEATSSSVRPVQFTYPLLDLTFANGGVKGEVDLPGINELLPFKIINDHIVAEFDAIKAFFVKALKRQTIKVSTTLRFVDGEPQLGRATSPQIDRINGEMLELFRARAVKSLLNFDPVKTVDKSLFTPEDVFASLDDDELGKATLPTDGHDLLAEILRHKKVRNARQLEFLAGTLHEAHTKLRYVLSPSFGFVFLATGQDANHFILELLDSHATYVWSIPKAWESLNAQFRSVEREIAAIGQLGRGQYRRTLHFEHEFWFVIHENAESGLVDGFPRWRNRLLEGLV
ncbi:hypothetical protein FUA23_05250 [Neolewinella aurantiaca]|uniref:Uncharacterized protein n=1 Tax=Neolewinella aurantiaca TaxID=2602767 RepID=A0A5C7FJM8_9BACT|nr:hypothetical protein [Neolewinella aurantiaca]TXF90846.1 hypothetical protein FUA23_05250 [Neolewinella aurantiaca]